MRTLGVIGGMSWESTLVYYRLLNEGVRARLGGLHSAELVLHSVDFEPIERMQSAADWDGAGERLAAIGARLEGAGAEALVLATNTMHKVAPVIEARVSIPLLHIADATGEAAREAGLARLALLGTRFTMEQPFYRDRLRNRFGLDVCVPDASGRAEVDRIIYQELCLGRAEPASRERYRCVIGQLVAAGAEAVILGCTEIGLLVGPGDSPVPLLDTTALHAQAAVRWMLDG